MLIKNNKVILRDTIISDIDDIIYWNTVATEWMLWDAPWEHEEDNFDWKQYRIDKKEELLKPKEDSSLRTRLEVCINDESCTHIGSISCYFINDEYKIDENGKKVAIGMDIYETKYRGQGYGKSAYLLYIDYLKKLGYTTIYTQTWSGNIPLIKMCEKVGFEECNRYREIRNVNNQKYDGLTFSYQTQN